ncbi:hypothetical protein FIBSPDRAFT_901512 [Athelia psychrophila]|uniref:Uncharacterized protein n=1 Tax=Athelia psychrophila TaxID=1759441 RepID=A0A165X2N7_9AGAM|nr:hypothetical protein FIBSPDRAFT_901512 [Fibularhizoctonia sp. CBS 109695]
MIPPILPILVIPDTRLTSPYTILPKPNVIDDFLLLSGINAGCTEPTSITHQDDFFEDLFLYSLVMHVDIPEASGLPAEYLSSARITIGAFEGPALHKDAPGWTRIPSGMAFEIRQPRVGMAYLFAELSWWPENVAVASSQHNYTFKATLTLTFLIQQKGLSFAMQWWSKKIKSWTFVLDDVINITRELPLWTHLFGPFPVFYPEPTLGLRRKKDRYRIDPGKLRRMQDLQLSQQQQSLANGPRRSSRLRHKAAKYAGYTNPSRMSRGVGT